MYQVYWVNQSQKCALFREILKNFMSIQRKSQIRWLRLKEHFFLRIGLRALLDKRSVLEVGEITEPIW